MHECVIAEEAHALNLQTLRLPMPRAQRWRLPGHVGDGCCARSAVRANSPEQPALPMASAARCVCAFVKQTPCPSKAIWCSTNKKPGHFGNIS
jgi:hypothetical protein